MSEPKVFVTDDVGDGGIDKAFKLLAGIPHGAEKAVGSAMKRAAQSGQTLAAKAIAENYVIKAGDFKRFTKTHKHYTTSGGSTTAEITFAGQHIALSKFDTTITKDGRVSARVKKQNSKAVIEGAFGSSTGKHTGIFERTGPKRLPIRELLGPSTPQMMSANDDIAQDIGDKIRETFEERIDHEITAVLNGWRQ